MRKISLYLQISLDGIVSDVERWASISDEIILDALDAYTGKTDTVIFGGNTYTSMADYWQKAEQSSPSLLEKTFASSINHIEKFVISRSKKELTWSRSKQLLVRDKADIVTEMEKLKQMEGKNISVESGVGLWQIFIEKELFDEIRLLVHPVMAIEGEKLFTGNENWLKLELAGTKRYTNGVVELHYLKK